MSFLHLTCNMDCDCLIMTCLFCIIDALSHRTLMRPALVCEPSQGQQLLNSRNKMLRTVFGTANSRDLQEVSKKLPLSVIPKLIQNPSIAAWTYHRIYTPLARTLPLLTLPSYRSGNACWQTFPVHWKSIGRAMLCNSGLVGR